MSKKNEEGNTTVSTVVSAELTTAAAELAAAVDQAAVELTAVELAAAKAATTKATADATAVELAAAVASGNFTLAAQLAKRASNEEKLSKLAAAELAAAQLAANETKTVNLAAAELAAQLTSGAGNFTLTTLWNLINTTIPAQKTAKATKATKATKAIKSSGDKVTKLGLTLETVSDGLGTLDELTKKFIQYFPEDTEPELHAKQYLSKYARKNGDFYAAK